MPLGRFSGQAAQPAASQNLDDLLVTFEDGAVQSIEDAEAFGQEGNPEMQDRATMAALTYATLALMIGRKMERG